MEYKEEVRIMLGMGFRVMLGVGLVLGCRVKVDLSDLSDLRGIFYKLAQYRFGHPKEK